eukprot:CAMPEP_0170547104 /NCGR_PEP_ID=MMETSP0211-20121228/5442_1 /TAXON_ID=311385 /ORGANISM="Pseudokeronopsis sp., Strain OXSARD2" /LENGTH=55 /DNA_ID=CAMNT_0010851911 /DNA_START=1 /DNA_END=164 /DNA_ORIENTATION=-
MADAFIEQQLVVDEASLPQLDAKKIAWSSFLHNRTDSIQEIDEPQEDRMAEALSS